MNTLTVYINNIHTFDIYGSNKYNVKKVKVSNKFLKACVLNEKILN